MLGLKHGINLLVDYDPEWPFAFEEERRRIHSALGDIARGIEHYGSTSVEGLRAKPVIDLLVGVAELDDWVKCKLPLERLGYDYAERAGVPDHFIFGRGRDRSERTHLVHVVKFDSESWRSCLMKERAVALAPDGRARYQELKPSFIEEAIATRL